MDMYFNMHKVRFEQLDDMFMKHINSLKKDISPKSRANVFINIEPLLKRLTRPDLVERLHSKEHKELKFVSNILNLAAHYRLYFKSKGMINQVFLYFGYPFDSSFGDNMDVKGYRKSYTEKYTQDAYGKYIGNLVNNSIGIIKTILEYIEGVYLITSDFYEPSLIPLLMESKENLGQDINILITNDRYEYQYAMHDWLIIRPKVRGHYMISPENVLQTMATEDKVGVSTEGLSVGYIPIILSFLGSVERDIEKIHGVGLSRMLNMIHKGIKMGHLTNRTTSFSSFSTILKDDIKERILSNYMLTDLQTQLIPLQDSKSLNIALGRMMVDKYDESSLRKLNERYFEAIDSHVMFDQLLPIVTKKVKMFDDRQRPRR